MSSVRVGSLFGIPIRLGASFLLVVPVIAFLVGSQIELTVDLLNDLYPRDIDAGGLSEGAMPWLLGLAAALGLFLSVLLHELGHSLVGRRYGLEIEAITLWFLGGLAQFSEFPRDWRQEFTIAVVGPVVSVAVGVACFAGFTLLPGGQHAALFVLGYLAVLNVVLAAFNMLPGFPMDGGRVLRALLSRNRSRVRATQIAASVGKGFAILLGILGILSLNLFWVLIAFFVYLAATAETQQVLHEAAFEGLTVQEIMTPAESLDTVSPETSLSSLLERMIVDRHSGYPVVPAEEDGAPGRSVVGMVTLEDVQSVALAERDATTVRDVMSTDLVTVDPRDDPIAALRALQTEGIGRVLVTGPDGALVGLLSRSDLMHVLEVAQVGGPGALTRRTPGDLAGR